MVILGNLFYFNIFNFASSDSLLIELGESFINLSVLIHLVCLVTEPNGFISSDYLYCICLSVH